MKTDWTRIIGWAIPLFCIALAGYLIFHQHAAFLDANKEFQDAQLQESAASLAKDQAEKESGTMRVAAIAPSLSEEPKFLNGLRTKAAQEGILITKWSSQPPTQPTNGAGANPDPNSTIDPAIKSIVKIQSQLTLAGPYKGIRDFLFYISHRNRFYTFSNMRWSLKPGPNVELDTTITRYVDPTLTVETTELKSKKRI